jgi:hypothetical protein
MTVDEVVAALNRAGLTATDECSIVRIAELPSVMIQIDETATMRVMYDEQVLHVTVFHAVKDLVRTLTASATLLRRLRRESGDA